MKIATFNINNINKRLANLLHWLRTAKPDVVSLQELKAADAEFPQAALAKAGYGAAWRGQKSWNGVAILGRDCEPIVTRTELPGDPADKQSRYIEAAVHGVLITSLYAPNGNPQPGPKFAYKLTWMERLATHAGELCGAGIPVRFNNRYGPTFTVPKAVNPSFGGRIRNLSDPAGKMGKTNWTFVAHTTALDGYDVSVVVLDDPRRRTRDQCTSSFFRGRR